MVSDSLNFFVSFCAQVKRDRAAARDSRRSLELAKLVSVSLAAAELPECLRSKEQCKDIQLAGLMIFKGHRKTHRRCENIHSVIYSNSPSNVTLLQLEVFVCLCCCIVKSVLWHPVSGGTASDHNNVTVVLSYSKVSVCSLNHCLTHLEKVWIS